ncbi:hypothetical protein F5050DRAFT_1533745, partial [Lentinula boryana]
AYLASRLESLEKQFVTSANAVRYPEKKCGNCQRNGHVMEECFRKGGGKEGQYPAWWRGKKDVNGGAIAANLATAPGKNNPKVAELTQYYGLTAYRQERDSSEIYADTGASDHFFRDRDDFVTY